MADIVSSRKRSEIMSRIRGKNTRPELTIRSILHVNGFRFRLHVKGLPGKPDLFLRKYNAAIFVNGCFWHGHDCSLYRLPKSNTEFWSDKIASNRSNDSRNISELHKSGIRVMLIWECSLKGKGKISLDEVLEKSKDWLLSNQFFCEIRGTQ